MKKILLSISTITTTILPIVAFTSCGAVDSGPVIQLKNSEVAKNGKALLKTYNDKTPIKKINISILTAGGSVEDKSFNQSSLETAIFLVDQLKTLNEEAIKKDGDKEEKEFKHIVTPYNTADATDSTMGQTYTQALEAKSNIWVTPGFQHGKALNTWLGNAENRKKFIKNKIQVIGIDWTPYENPNIDKVKGQVINLLFKTQQPGYVIGYAASKYLVEQYPANPEKWVLAGLGGGDFPGVTNFLIGYFKGILAWNKENSTKKVKWYDNDIVLNTGFDKSKSEAISAINKIVNHAKKPQIILSAAGSLTSSVLASISDNETGALVIGVDTDQSLAFPEESNLLFSSILKKIDKGLYQVLITLLTKDYDSSIFGAKSSFKPFTQDYDDVYNSAGELKKDVVIDAKNVITILGFEKDSVGVANTTITLGKTKEDSKMTGRQIAEFAIIKGKEKWDEVKGQENLFQFPSAKNLKKIITEINK